jgi:hypothetical protein
LTEAAVTADDDVERLLRTLPSTLVECSVWVRSQAEKNAAAGSPAPAAAAAAVAPAVAASGTASAVLSALPVGCVIVQHGRASAGAGGDAVTSAPTASPAFPPLPADGKSEEWSVFDGRPDAGTNTFLNVVEALDLRSMATVPPRLMTNADRRHAVRRRRM